MTRPILPRNNFFDGQQISETDLDVEQSAWLETTANAVDFLAGSGVEKEFATQRILFDSDDVPASIQTLIDTTNFDGEPIYSVDSFNQTVYLQPSDSFEGNQMEIEVSDADLDGTPSMRIYVFGLIFGGEFVQEVLTFETNESQITKNYYTQIVALMTQDFRGNQNTTITGVASRDSGGRIRILESLPMTVARDVVMVEQAIEPNMNYVNFKPATLSKTLDILLNEIADSATLNPNDLRINVTATDERELPPNDSTGLIVGQKFQATTDNIQKISLLLSVERNDLALPGEEFDWTGDIVVAIRRLQTTTTCPTDTIPDTEIEFDPEPAPIAEVSFDQEQLKELGVSLTDSPHVVDFIFTQSLLANPNLEPQIIPGRYYVVTVRRTGNVSKGTLILQEAANTDAQPDERDNMRMTVFSQNTWTDIPESDLWFRIFTNAVRITSGTAFDNGRQITSPKTKENNLGVTEPFVEGHHSLVDVSQSAKNYVIVQQKDNFTTAVPHPSTGNPVFTRIEDTPDVAVVSEDTLVTLINAGNENIVLGSAQDINPVDNPSIEGRTEFPGLVREDTFTIIQPNADILLNNLVGSILIPNVDEPDFKYRIIKVEEFDDAYGDINADGLIDLNDVARANDLDGYSKTLEDGSLLSTDQRAAIVNRTIAMEEILRADVTNNGTINIFDPQAIQQNIALGTAFEAGSSFKRVVLTVENLTNPLTTTPNIIGSDPSFNDVPFTPVEFRIDFVPLWQPENLILGDLRRFIPKTFTQIEEEDITGTPQNGGTNISFIPGNVLLDGNLLDVEGNPYSIDMEVNTIIIDLPEGSTQGEIDIFNNFIRNQMTYSDGSLVTGTALANNQVKVTSSIKSFVKDTDGYDFSSVDGYAAIDETVSVLYTQDSGILRIRANNVRNIVTRPELRTKIVLTVYLKKAGFNNEEVQVTSSRLQELLTAV